LSIDRSTDQPTSRAAADQPINVASADRPISSKHQPINRLAEHQTINRSTDKPSTSRPTDQPISRESADHPTSRHTGPQPTNRSTDLFLVGLLAYRLQPKIVEHSKLALCIRQACHSKLHDLGRCGTPVHRHELFSRIADQLVLMTVNSPKHAISTFRCRLFVFSLSLPSGTVAVWRCAPRDMYRPQIG
jgi:hypothetical protein